MPPAGMISDGRGANDWDVSEGYEGGRGQKQTYHTRARQGVIQNTAGLAMLSRLGAGTSSRLRARLTGVSFTSASAAGLFD